MPCVLVKIVDCYAKTSIQGGDICSLFHLALFPYKIGHIPSLMQVVDNSFQVFSLHFKNSHIALSYDTSCHEIKAFLRISHKNILKCNHIIYDIAYLEAQKPEYNSATNLYKELKCSIVESSM